VTLARSAAAAPSVPVVAAICAAEILGLAGFSIIPALLPQFIDAWSLTNTQAGWLAGIVSAGYMFAVIPLVSLTDRRPARQLYLASGVLSALSCFGMAPMLLMQFGSMGKDLAAYNTKLFAERVLPKLRGLFSEWEDKWWPQPMPRPERAEVPAFQSRLAAE
jgi:MFS family permease